MYFTILQLWDFYNKSYFKLIIMMNGHVEESPHMEKLVINKYVSWGYLSSNGRSLRRNAVALNILVHDVRYKLILWTLGRQAKIFLLILTTVLNNDIQIIHSDSIETSENNSDNVVVNKYVDDVTFYINEQMKSYIDEYRCINILTYVK